MKNVSGYILLVGLFATTAFAQTSSYDKFKDLTIVQTATKSQLAANAQDRNVHLELTAFYKFSGTSITEPVKEMYVLVTVLYVESGELVGSNLIFLADSKRIDMGRGVECGSGARSKYSIVKVCFTPSAADIGIISNARTVEFQLGDFEGKLDKSLKDELLLLHNSTKKP